MRRARSVRSGVAAAALGAILPGLGHVYIGRWWRAVAMAAPTIAFAAFAVVLFNMPRFDLLGILVTPGVLRGVLVANLVIVIWRVVAVIDPYRLSKGTRSPWTLVTVFLFGFLVAVPHVAIARYTIDAAYALNQVFVSGDIIPVVVLEEPSPTAAPLPEEEIVLEVIDPASLRAVRRTSKPRSLLFTEGVGDPDAIGVPRWRADPPRRSLGSMLGADYDGVSRITILLVGGDGGPGRTGNRSDSIMVATFDTETGKSAVFGIPRNMSQVPLPDAWSTAFVELEKRLTPWSIRSKWTDDDGDGEPDQFVSCLCFPDQINAIYPYTRKWVDTYPDEVDPGLAALRDTLEIMLGLEIDYYAMVDMSGFVRLVNALGGVRVYVTRGVKADVSPATEGDEWIHVDIEPGWNRLDGHEALAYVRDRKSASDYSRMTRQRCLLKSVAARADAVTLATRFSHISRAVGSSVRTNIPIALLPGLVRRGSSLDFDDIATIGFVPPFYTPVLDARGKPTPDLLRIQAIVRWALNAEQDTEFDTGRESECGI